MGKTLKIFSRSGYTVYIRYLYSRYYEILVAHSNHVYSRFVWIEKPHATEKRITPEQRDAAAILELSTAAVVLIENLKQEGSIVNKLKNHFTKKWHRIKGWMPTKAQD